MVGDHGAGPGELGMVEHLQKNLVRVHSSPNQKEV
jgi:hypothetical protein